VVIRPSKDDICKGIKAAWQAKINIVDNRANSMSEKEFRREHGRISKDYGNQCLANGCLDDGFFLLNGAVMDFTTSGDEDEARAILDQIDAIVKRLRGQ
jgi:hypothetical protein